MGSEGHGMGLTDAAQQQLPWVMTALLAAWGFTVRFLLGRQIRSNDKTASDISEIKQRISLIEGHLGIQRRNAGPEWWDNQ